MSDEIIAEKVSDVLMLTISRTSKRNALTEPMYAALSDHLDQAQTDSGTRVVLLLAAGESFTAGNDLATFASASSAADAQSAAPGNASRFINCLAVAHKPLVAGVQGHAVGIGCTLLLHCDFVVVAHDASLAAPFVNLALVPEAASSLLMVERIGYARSFALFAMGQAITGDEAVAYGLASKAVAASEVRAEAIAAAHRLAALPQGSLLATRKLMRNQIGVLAQIKDENEQFRRQLVSAEAREVFKALAEKRKPDFSKIQPET
jgi:enoyl-CoA hydratase/carnithine racemase